MSAVIREQLQPPIDLRADPFGRDLDFAPATFADLSEECQCARIRAYMCKHEVQLGLFGEALHEHALSTQIAQAFYANDQEAFGRLAFRAVREYVGKVIDQDQEVSSCA